MRATKKDLVKFQLYFNILFLLFASALGINRGILLLADLLNIFLIIDWKTHSLIYSSKMKKVILITILFIIVGSLGSLDFADSFLIYIWGVRYYLRFYVYMMACVLYLALDDLRDLCDFLFRKLAIFNIILVLFQSYVMHLFGDQVGGIMGISAGCNAALNTYLVCVCAYACAKSISKEYSIIELMFWVATSFICCAYSELKMGFINIILILLMMLLFSDVTKKIKYGVIILISLYFAFQILTIISPSSVSFLTDLDLLIWYNTDISYGDAEAGLNRLNALEVIQTYIFDKEGVSNLLGVGIGSGNKINFLNIFSDIYTRYGGMRYDWFTHAFLFVETGYIGLFLYYLVFITVGIKSVIEMKKSNREDKPWYFMALAVVVITLINTIYNNAAIMESSGYLIYFCLSIPYIVCGSKLEES